MDNNSIGQPFLTWLFTHIVIKKGHQLLGCSHPRHVLMHVNERAIKKHISQRFSLLTIKIKFNPTTGGNKAAFTFEILFIGRNIADELPYQHKGDLTTMAPLLVLFLDLF